MLFALSEDLPSALFLDSRGWSAAEWDAARDRLDRRHLVAGDRITPAGRALRADIEETTDRLAALPFAGLGVEEAMGAYEQLAGVSGTVAAAGVIPFPNPMGLPAPTPG